MMAVFQARWFKRVSAAVSFYAAFAPCFASGGDGQPAYLRASDTVCPRVEKGWELAGG